MRTPRELFFVWFQSIEGTLGVLRCWEKGMCGLNTWCSKFTSQCDFTLLSPSFAHLSCSLIEHNLITWARRENCRNIMIFFKCACALDCTAKRILNLVASVCEGRTHVHLSEVIWTMLEESSRKTKLLHFRMSSFLLLSEWCQFV